MPGEQVAVTLHTNIVAPEGLDSDVPEGQVGEGGVTVHTPFVALKVPDEQLGVELQLKMLAPLSLESVVPVGHEGVGGVTVQVPDAAAKVPMEQVGAAFALQVYRFEPLNLPRVVPAGQVRVLFTLEQVSLVWL